MPENHKLSDIEIFKSLKSGSIKAFEIIYHKYWPKLFDQAYRRVADEELVKEFVQDLFTELWQNRHKTEIKTSLSSYLQQSLKYKLYNYYKSKQVQSKYIDFASYCATTDSNAQNQTEQHIYYVDLSQAIKKCVDDLPKQTRSAYRLQQNEGLTYSEIAANLKISTSTVEKHIMKALKAIREGLKYYILILFLFL